MDSTNIRAMVHIGNSQEQGDRYHLHYNGTWSYTWNVIKYNNILASYRNNDSNNGFFRVHIDKLIIPETAKNIQITTA